MVLAQPKLNQPSFHKKIWSQTEQKYDFSYNLLIPQPTQIDDFVWQAPHLE